MRPAAALVLLGALAGGCVTQTTSYESAYAPMEAHARATLEPTKGSTVSGQASFAQRGGKLFVNATVRGLAPNSEHGFHIHEKGDCSSGDGMSAGGHFDPGGKPHGDMHAGEHHAGDMPNIRADANGVANVNVELTGVGIGSGPADIVGRGLIVHRDPDDYKSQPAGNAGPRLACAVIQRG